eukprot:EG_transcript_9935
MSNFVSDPGYLHRFLLKGLVGQVLCLGLSMALTDSLADDPPPHGIPAIPLDVVQIRPFEASDEADLMAFQTEAVQHRHIPIVLQPTPIWRAVANAFPLNIVRVAVTPEKRVVGVASVGLTTSVIGDGSKPRCVAYFFNVSVPPTMPAAPLTKALVEKTTASAVGLGAEVGYSCTLQDYTKACKAAGLKPGDPNIGLIDLLIKVVYRVSLTVDPLPYGARLRRLSTVEVAGRWKEWFGQRPLFPLGDVDVLLRSPAIVETLYAEHPTSRSEASITIYNKTHLAKLLLPRLPWPVRLFLKWPELWWGDRRLVEGQETRVWALVGVHMRGSRGPDLLQHLVDLSLERADLASVPLVLLPNVRDPQYDISHIMPSTVSVPVVVQVRSVPGVSVKVDVSKMFPDPRL